MKKRESTAFADVLAAPAAPAVLDNGNFYSVPPKPPKRGRGRPKKREEKPQTTTIRLSSDDHMKVRMLAIRGKIAMNTLVFNALSAYCFSQGVILNNNNEFLKS